MSISFKAGDFSNFEDVLKTAGLVAKVGFETNFTSDMDQRYETYGDNMYLSEKQIAKLTDIAKVDLKVKAKKIAEAKPAPIDKEIDDIPF